MKIDKNEYLEQIKNMKIDRDNYVVEIRDLILDQENYIEQINKLNTTNDIQLIEIEKLKQYNANKIIEIEHRESMINTKMNLIIEEFNCNNIEINNKKNELIKMENNKIDEINNYNIKLKNLENTYNEKLNELKIIKENINRYNIELIDKTSKLDKKIDHNNNEETELQIQINSRNIYTLQGIKFIFIDNDIGLNIQDKQLFDLKIFKCIELKSDVDKITNGSELIRAIIYKISYSQYMYTQQPYNAIKKCITHLCPDGGLHGIIKNDYKLWTITNFDKQYIDILIDIIQRTVNIPIHDLTSCFSLIFDCLGHSKEHYANLLNKSYDFRLSNPQYKFDEDIIYWFIQNTIHLK
jgi:hypothetical protein